MKAAVAVAVLALAASALAAAAQNATVEIRVDVPSETEVAFTDAFMSSVLVLASVAVLVYYHVSRRRLYVLLLGGLAVFTLSVVALSTRSAVPTGAYLNATTGEVVFTYGENPYARLYVAPLAFSIGIMAYALLDFLRRIARLF